MQTFIHSFLFCGINSFSLEQLLEGKINALHSILGFRVPEISEHSSSYFYFLIQQGEYDSLVFYNSCTLEKRSNLLVCESVALWLKRKFDGFGCFEAHTITQLAMTKIIVTVFYRITPPKKLNCHFLINSG